MARAPQAQPMTNEIAEGEQERVEPF